MSNSNNEEEKSFDNLGDLIEHASYEAEGKPVNMSRARPYSGQVHTVYGERGKQLIEGLTMRDITDCFVRAVLIASNHSISEELYAEAEKSEQALLNSSDLYGFNLDDSDPNAIRQAMICEIEKMMGIFPNITKVVEE